MSVFIRSFLFILIIILSLLTNGTFERILYMVLGILLYLIISKEKNNKFGYYKKVISGLIIGYLIANTILISSKYEIAYEKFNNNNISDNKTAIILLFDIDLPTYKPSILIKNFKDTNAFLKFYKLPFDLYKHKILIEKFGRNINTFYSELITKKLQENLGEDYIVYKGYVNQAPYIEETIQQAINNGNSQIIVTPISLVGTKDIELHHGMVQETKFQTESVKFKSTNYLWDSELIAESYLEKVNSSIQVIDKSRAGIVLIGEVFNKETLNETYIKQDVLFREKIRNLLKKDGYDNNKIRLSFLNKRLIEEEVGRLMEYGVGQIIIVHVSNQSQKNSSLEMVQNVMKSLEVPQDIKFVQIYGWAPDEYMIHELLKRIELAKYKANE
ncbi:hypothetical protein KQI88_12745 [Alkaliphilus sp. MSJ-5]|uniref:Uncharacterized protein n=1 Tax=Alkaliphilus flagellatus TaxID=2841507 RepID=A0ABS6G6D0_9FIRM|nr:hypothetical protein [Alkaliphilus flagellatus]MBU5677282.1 hypothetical protein [Alkaliphilus flagellatus]